MATFAGGHLHGRVCGHDTSASIGRTNHDRRTHRHSIKFFVNPGQVNGAGRTLQRSVLAGLPACRALAAADPIVGSWAQGLQLRGVKHDDVVHSFAEALQEHLVPVLLHNLLAAWLSMWASGVAGLQLPVRYAITSSSAVLDCMFLVPLIPHADGDPGAHKIAKLAALQVRRCHLVPIT